MKIVNLASGSKGNCSYIESLNTHILIDVGVCFTELVKKLSEINVDVKKIDAILISHEHIDHIKGLQALLKAVPTLQIYAHPKTLRKITEKLYIPIGNQNPIVQTDFYVGDFAISAFSLSHDASACLGFSIYENGKKFSIATDMGYASEDVLNNLQGSELVFIESNYNSDMLYYNDKYPYVLKERINSKFGHLSNDDCAVVIEKLILSGTKKFALAHVSENTNNYNLALKTTKDYLTLKGCLDDNVFITVLNQYVISQIFYI